MKTLEYRTVDKSTWGNGPWSDEPDKRQWVDEDTGLPCLIVRNGRAGNLCGYVGVSPGHPWYGKSFSDRIAVEDRSQVEIDTGVIPLFLEAFHEDDGKISLNCLIQIHGGITFADSCHTPTREKFDNWRNGMIESKAEIEKYPQGSAAMRWRDVGHLLDDFDGWCDHMKKTSVCHAVEEGEPDNVWWFGFDCAHSGDYIPGYERGIRFSGEQYRDFEYVESEVRRLAKQLAEVGALAS